MLIIKKNKKKNIEKKFNKIISLNFFKYIKIFIIILILIIFINKNNIKVCLCVVGKLENNYIREFISYYKKYGVDKIFLYDNNDINGEKFDYILSDYIRKKYVKIYNIRGKIAQQIKIYQHCYTSNYKIFNWLIFIDIDEFIFLKNYNNIKDFLSQRKFNKCQSIYLNWVKHTDNNLIYYDNRTLHERFPEIYNKNNYCLGKTIIKGNLENIKIKSVHILDGKIGRCNGLGNLFKPIYKIFCYKPDFNNNYIDHYEYKSTEEFINKIKKGDCTYGYNKNNMYIRINRYFRFNEITLEKISLISQKTGLNISLIKKNIQKLKIFKNISHI